MKVLFTVILLWEGRVRERVVGIVTIDQVLDDLRKVTLVISQLYLLEGLLCTAPDSQRVIPVFGSSMVGTLRQKAWSARLFCFGRIE